jgi:parallel beta-helix repeat protein
VRVFVSHSHRDDDVTTRLVAELKRAGADVWVDKVSDAVGIDHGDFLEQINQALAASDWLILVLTPAAVQSPWVRLEVNAALAMAHDQEGRMHQPILYLAKPCSPSDIPPLWRPLHFYDAVANRGEVMAGLLRTLGVAGSLAPSSTSPGSDLSERAGTARNLSEPVTRLVDATGQGDYMTIAEGIHASNPGERLLIRPGRYQGVLHIDQPVELIGTGRMDEVIIEGKREDLIDFQADWGRLAHMTIRQLGGGKSSTAVGIHRGLLELEDCAIMSGNYGLYLYTNAAAHLQQCQVHECGGTAVYLERWANATLEESAVTGNGGDGVVVWEGSSAMLRNNRITGNGGVAVRVSGRSRCTAQDNDLRGNLMSWDIASAALKHVRRMRNRED